MVLLARNVDSAWWRTQLVEFAEDEVPADIVTNNKRSRKQLQTSNNALSFWRVDGDDLDTGLRDVVLAVASEFETPDGVDLAWFEKEVAEEAGVEFQPTPGATKVASLIERHEDAVRLDLQRLAKVASHLALAIRRHGQLRQFTRADVLSILAEGADQKRVRVDDLRKGMKEAVRQRLSKP